MNLYECLLISRLQSGRPSYQWRLQLGSSVAALLESLPQHFREHRIRNIGGLHHTHESLIPNYSVFAEGGFILAFKWLSPIEHDNLLSKFLAAEASQDGRPVLRRLELANES